MSAREAILQTVSELFFKQGYQAIGVDTIIREAGIAKATLYRHFPSKDDLIAAYLEDANAKFWQWFDAATAQAEEPRDQLVAIFHALEKLVTTPTCYGCPFLMAAVEFPDPAHPGHAVALAHKQEVRRRVLELVQAAGIREAEQLADHLYLLADGAFMAVRLHGIDNPARNLAAQVEKLIACYA